MSNSDTLRLYAKSLKYRYVDESTKILTLQKFHLSCHFLHISLIEKKCHMQIISALRFYFYSQASGVYLVDWISELIELNRI